MNDIERARKAAMVCKEACQYIGVELDLIAGFEALDVQHRPALVVVEAGRDLVSVGGIPKTNQLQIFLEALTAYDATREAKT